PWIPPSTNAGRPPARAADHPGLQHLSLLVHASKATPSHRINPRTLRLAWARIIQNHPARDSDKGLACNYAESSQPTWVQRIEKIEKANESPAILTSVQGASPSAPVSIAASQPVDQHPQGSRDPSPRELLAVNSIQSSLPSLEWYDSWSCRYDILLTQNRLTARHLPSSWKIGLLVEEYFNNIHPLRCFAFIHKPSFLQRLDGELSIKYQTHALLHIICALGAQFYALAYSETVARLPSKFVLLAGGEWAKISQRLILEAIDTVTIENLMAAVLLHDYAVRMGNFANAFMLSGLITRMTQALQINLEYNTDLLCQDAETGPSATDKESRRRLMWSCYVMDALVGSGVDQLTLVEERDMKIQLPCNERNFLQQRPCLTETLEPGNWLKFIPGELDTDTILPNMGIMAYFIRHISIRKRVLRYIKHLGDAKVPWDPDSEFAKLDADCRAWYESLPASLQFMPDAIYIRKDSSQLGALCEPPALYKLRAAFDFPPEQQGFLRHLQQVLFDAARTLASIIGETMRHDSRMLADSWLPTIAYDSCRIMVYHLTQILDPRIESTRLIMRQTVPLLQSNITALKVMGNISGIADSLCSAAETMLNRSRIESEAITQNIVPDDPYPTQEGDDPSESLPGTPVQSAPDYVLNPLSIFRMARKSIPERHAPEKAGTSSAPNSVLPESTADPDHPREGSIEGGCGQSISNEPEFGQASLEELQTLFMSDLGWAWQPAETAVGSGIEAAGLLPWAGGYQITQAEPWLPVFPFAQQD
ncbi:hypothetical protein N7474_007551, partial [Penicillium riverlandense]|uniref:uncharacterized protein n=1 Tax=Penicillium riverlandense TaxID=1903569 RepID=UPI0025490909